jgi:hypothetical protein
MMAAKIPAWRVEVDELCSSIMYEDGETLGIPSKSLVTAALEHCS